jgi:hypothetical protein
MQTQYKRKTETRKKPGQGSKLTLHYLIGNQSVCWTEYQLTPDCKYNEIPMAVIARTRVS